MEIILWDFIYHPGVDQRQGNNSRPGISYPLSCPTPVPPKRKAQVGATSYLSNNTFTSHQHPHLWIFLLLFPLLVIQPSPSSVPLTCSSNSPNVGQSSYSWTYFNSLFHSLSFNLTTYETVSFSLSSCQQETPPPLGVTWLASMTLSSSRVTAHSKTSKQGLQSARSSCLALCCLHLTAFLVCCSGTHVLFSS